MGQHVHALRPTKIAAHVVITKGSWRGGIRVRTTGAEERRRRATVEKHSIVLPPPHRHTRTHTKQEPSSSAHNGASVWERHLRCLGGRGLERATPKVQNEQVCARPQQLWPLLTPPGGKGGVGSNPSSEFTGTQHFCYLLLFRTSSFCQCSAHLISVWKKSR